MFAITTKYLGPTDTKPARITAQWRRYDGQLMKVTIEYDHGMPTRDNHAAAAMKLCRMTIDAGNGWTCGETDNGYVFVMLGETFTKFFGKQNGMA